MRKTGAINFNIPSGIETETMSISSFKGLHISDNPLVTEQSSAADMKNVYLTLENTLSTRPRLDIKVSQPFNDVKFVISYIALSDDKVLYHYKDTSDNIKLYINSTAITDGNLVGNNKISAFKKDDKVYVLSDEGYFVIYNDTLHNVIGDANTYIPITSTIIDGIESPYESDNLLSDKYRKVVSWNGTDSLYELASSELYKNNYYESTEFEYVSYKDSTYPVSWVKSKSGTFITRQKDSNNNIKLLKYERYLTEPTDITSYITYDSDAVLSDNGRFLLVKTGNNSLTVYDLDDLSSSRSITTTNSLTSTNKRHLSISSDGTNVWVSYTSDGVSYYIWNGIAYTEYNYTTLYKGISAYDESSNCMYVPLTNLMCRYYIYNNQITIETFNKPTTYASLAFVSSDYKSLIVRNGNQNYFKFTIGEDFEKSYDIIDVLYSNTICVDGLMYGIKNNKLYQIDFEHNTNILLYENDDITLLDLADGQILYYKNYEDVVELNILYFNYDTKPKLEYLYNKNYSQQIDNLKDLNSVETTYTADGDNTGTFVIPLNLYNSDGKKIYRIKIVTNSIYNPNTDSYDAEVNWDSKLILDQSLWDSVTWSDSGDYRYTYYIDLPGNQIAAELNIGGYQTGYNQGFKVILYYSEKPIIENANIPLSYSKNFYNNYWFCYKNKLYNTEYNDPTYIPVNNVSVLGNDDDITGMTLLTDSTMCVYKKDKQFIVYASTDSSGKVLYYNTEMKTDQGNLPKFQTLVTPVNEHPLQFNDRGIFVLNIPKDINTDTNSALSISDKINPKFLTELNKENIITHNHLYWTYVILPQSNYSKIYVLDNRTTEWYYWELPIKISGCREVYNTYDILKDYDGETIGIYNNNSWVKIIYNYEDETYTTFTPADTDYYDRKFVTDTEFITDTGVLYTFTTMDFYDDETSLGTIYCDLLDNGDGRYFSPIPWYWESEIMPLSLTKYYKEYPAVGYGKQLYQTGFLFVDSDKSEDYELNYQFTVYRKHMADKNTKALPANTLNYIRSVVKRTRIPKFNFMKIRLSSPEDIAKNRFNLISLKFKYKLTQEVK